MPSIIFAGFLLIYYLFGLIDTKAMLNHFTNEALVILVLLILISSVLEKTPVIRGLMEYIFVEGSERRSMLRLSSITAFFSAFLNNTAVVAMMMGVVKKNRFFPASRFLIPLSFVAILGGTMTLIGTSTNLFINGFVISSGMESLKIFDFTLIGLPIVIAGIIYCVLFTRFFFHVEERGGEQEQGRYFVEARIDAGSPLVGKSVHENRFRSMENLFLAEIIRDNHHLVSPVRPDEILEAGDILVFTGDVNDIQELQRFVGLKIFDMDSKILESNLVEVVLSHESTLVGTKIKDANFRSKFDSAVVAVNRGDQRLSGKLGLIELKAGDWLLLAHGEDFNKHDNLKKNFYFLSETENKGVLTNQQGYFAFALFFGVVALSTLGIVSLIKGLLFLMAVLVFTGMSSSQEIKRIIPFHLILIIGAAFGVADVIQNSGAALLISEGIVSLGSGMDVWTVFVLIFVSTAVLTNLVTNSAAAALVFPIAYSMSTLYNTNPYTFIMAVAFGASASFLTPYGYQTNLMVYSLGKYKYGDYLRFGLPLLIIYSILAVFLIPLFFPFDGV